MYQSQVRIAGRAHEVLLIRQDCRAHSCDPVAGHSCQGQLPAQAVACGLICSFYPTARHLAALYCLQVIAEDVAAVIINCGPVPAPAQPSHALPAFPEAATTNHDANDDHILHETREFWGRLQPQSLVPLLQTVSSKGKGRMPSSLLQIPHSSSSRESVHPQGGSSNPGSGKSPADGLHRTSSQSNPRSSSDLGPRDGILLTSSTYCGPRDHQDGSNHSSRDTTAGSRTVHFDLPSSSDSSGDDESRQASGEMLHKGQASGEMLHKSQDSHADHASTTAENRIRKKSPPMDISFRFTFHSACCLLCVCLSVVEVQVLSVLKFKLQCTTVARLGLFWLKCNVTVTCSCQHQMAHTSAFQHLVLRDVSSACYHETLHVQTQTTVLKQLAKKATAGLRRL